MKNLQDTTIYKISADSITTETNFDKGYTVSVIQSNSENSGIIYNPIFTSLFFL